MSHYGGSFGSEAMQTSIPSCMNKMHLNYLWSSKVIHGSEVCNRASACTVLHRASSNIAKVDRTGQVKATGALQRLHFRPCMAWYVVCKLSVKFAGVIARVTPPRLCMS
jgi:hypothetical protein